MARLSKGAKAASVALGFLLIGGSVTWQHYRAIASMPKIFYPQSGGFGGALPYAGEQPWSFGAVALCLTKPGSVTVTGIVPVGSNGQILPLAFAVRRMPSEGLGAAQESLTQAGFPQSAIVDVVCRDDTAPDELGTTFQLLPGANPSGRFTSLRVDYVSKGHRFSVNVPWTLKLCGPARTTDETCGTSDTP